MADPAFRARWRRMGDIDSLCALLGGYILFLCAHPKGWPRAIAGIDDALVGFQTGRAQTRLGITTNPIH